VATKLLKGGYVIIVDDDDSAVISRGGWHRKVDKRGYAFVSGTGDKILARIILGAKTGEVVDHINGDTLDNRRANLRLTNWSGNARNKRGSGTSGRKGVTFHKKAQKWQVQIRHMGIDIYLGLFEDLDAAARTYDDVANKLFGEFSKPNFGRNK